MPDQALLETQENKKPSLEVVEKLLNLDVLDEQGKEVKFRLVVDDKSYPRVVTVFIRHFFCGFCEEYVRAIAKDLPAKSLAAAEPSTKLVFIGCGDPSLIADYKKRTSSDYEIYADPSRKTYDTLGFKVTLAKGETPGYSQRSFLSVVASSLVNNLSAGTKALSGGKTSQNGGELIWDKGELKLIQRMPNTSTHMEIPQLKKELGI